MQRMIGTLRQHRIDSDQILHLTDLGRQNDLVASKANLFRKIGGNQGRLHDGLAHDFLRAQWCACILIAVHQRGQKLLIERTPVHADTDRLVVTDRHFDDIGELLVLLVLETDIARIDAIFRKRFRAGRMICEQLVADIMKVADQRHVMSQTLQPFTNFRHGSSGFIAIHRNAHNLGPCAVQGCDLRDGGIHIRRIRIGHRLHDNGRTAADDNATDANTNRLAARERMREIADGLGRHFALFLTGSALIRISIYIITCRRIVALSLCASS